MEQILTLHIQELLEHTVLGFQDVVDRRAIEEPESRDHHAPDEFGAQKALRDPLCDDCAAHAVSDDADLVTYVLTGAHGFERGRYIVPGGRVDREIRELVLAIHLVRAPVARAPVQRPYVEPLGQEMGGERPRLVDPECVAGGARSVDQQDGLAGSGVVPQLEIAFVGSPDRDSWRCRRLDRHGSARPVAEGVQSLDPG